MQASRLTNLAQRGGALLEDVENIFTNESVKPALSPGDGQATPPTLPGAVFDPIVLLIYPDGVRVKVPLSTAQVLAIREEDVQIRQLWQEPEERKLVRRYTAEENEEANRLAAEPMKDLVYKTTSEGKDAAATDAATLTQISHVMQRPNADLLNRTKRFRYQKFAEGKLDSLCGNSKEICKYSTSTLHSLPDPHFRVVIHSSASC